MKVEAAVIPLQGVKAVNPSQVVEAGSAVDLTCSFTPSDATDKSISWESNKSDVVAVSQAADGGWEA